MSSIALNVLWLTLGTSTAWATVALGQSLAQQPISLQAENRTLQEVLKDIERQTDLTFVFSSSVPYQEKVSMTVEAEVLDHVLKQLLTPFQISYEVIDQQVILRKETTEEATLSTRR